MTKYFLVISVDLFNIKSDYQYKKHRMEFLKTMNYLKNLGLPKKKLNKIGFMYHYKNLYIKKPLGHL